MPHVVRNSLLALLMISARHLAADEPGQLVLGHQFQVITEVSMPHASVTGTANVLRSGISSVDWTPDWNGEFRWLSRTVPGFPTRTASVRTTECKLKQFGRTDRPVYENLNSANFIVTFPNDSPTTLHWNKGSHAETSDFRPMQDVLEQGSPKRIESFGGRSSDCAMPYFNLASEGGGLIVAIGWSGDWQATFDTKGQGKVHVVAGLKHARFRLEHNEQICLPSIVTMPYRGRPIDGQNLFRRVMLSQFTPRAASPAQLMPVAASVHGMLGFNDTTAENLGLLATDIASTKLPVDTFWLDAGWNEGGFPGGQGNPFADTARFPKGLKPVGDLVQSTGLRMLTWFEPERAMRGTWLEREHPEWLLKPSGTPEQLRYMENDGFRLLDFGNRDARQWAIETVSREITESGIDIYRQDFNEYPSFFWHTNEQPDEVGLREVRYITGLYEFLDELQRRHPKLIIDSCASGGRRLDFEMMRRSVCLWRSDSCWDQPTYPRNVQAMTHGLSHWLPLHGLGSVATDNVSLRSGMGACGSFAINYRDPAAVEALRKHLNRYLPVRRLFAEDYYPLTEWTDDPRQWLAFQFHDPTTGEGIVQAFCGPDPADESLSLKLDGVDPDKLYDITDWEKEGVRTMSGADLLQGNLDMQAASGHETVITLTYTPRGLN